MAEHPLFQDKKNFLKCYTMSFKRRFMCFHLSRWSQSNRAHRDRLLLTQLLNDKDLFPSAKDKIYFFKYALKTHDFHLVRLLETTNLEIHKVKLGNKKSTLHYLAELESGRKRNCFLAGGTMSLIKFFVNNPQENYRDEHGFTYFHGACMAGKRITVLKLLRAGVDVNLDTYACSPLHIAAQYRQKEIVDVLLKRGADPNARDHEQSTPLHALSRPCFCEYASCDNFCDCQKPVDDIVRMLVEKKADIEARDRHGDSPLQSSVSRFHVELTRSLLKHGADLNSLNQDRMFSWNFTTFEMKNFALTLNIIELMELLQSAGYKMDLKTRFRMIKCWCRIKGYDTEHLIPDVEEKKTFINFSYFKIIHNKFVIDYFGLYMEEVAQRHLLLKHRELKSKLPLNHPVYQLQRDKNWSLEVGKLKSIILNDDISLLELCQMDHEKGYSIIKKIKNFSVPQMNDLHHVKIFVKRHMANILIRRHLELFVSDLFMTDYCKLNMPYTVCREIAENMSRKDLLRLCHQTNENDLVESLPKCDAQKIPNPPSSTNAA
ncbi:hypothetical protein TKK_0019161 [Trichogramma kaykai]